MSVCCECCVLSGRGLCDELITRPEDSYRLWCVDACDLEKITLVNEDEGQDPLRGYRAKRIKIVRKFFFRLLFSAESNNTSQLLNGHSIAVSHPRSTNTSKTPL